MITTAVQTATAVIAQIEQATDSPQADVAILADLLQDMSAADRLTVFALIAEKLLSGKAAQKLSARRPSSTFTRDAVRLAVNCRVCDYPSGRIDEESLARQRMRRDVFQKLAESLENGHWYAVRTDCQLRPAIPFCGEGLSAKDLRLVVQIAPLDGGLVMTDKEG